MTFPPRAAIGWPALLLAASLIPMLLFAIDAFHGPFVIQDDARQFLAWTPRLLDPGAMSGDLLADYWRDASPPLFRWLYAGAAAIGVAPATFSKLLPIALVPATAALAWWVASALSRRPAVAFLSAATMMAVEIQTDSIWTGAPRGFMAPLYLLVLGGVARGNTPAAIVGLALLAAFYPAAAITGFTVFALSKVERGRRLPLVVSPRALAIVAIAALLVLVPLLAFRGDLARWGPVLTMAEAHRLPSFDQPSLGAAPVDPNAAFGWACSSRLGFLPRVAHCHKAFDLAALLDLLFLLPLIWRAARARRRDDAAGRLYGLVFVASILWFAIAAAVAFRLHLPSRYSQHQLAIAGGLALGQLIGDTIVAGAPWRRWLALPAAAALAFLFATPRAKLTRPDDPAAMAAIAQLPRDARIAGVGEDLNFVPALLGRATLATTEHAIPYHLGYYRQVRARMAATLDAVTTGDPARLAAFVRRWRPDVLAVDRATLATGKVDNRYALTVPDAMRAVAGRPVPSALARAAPACAIARTGSLALIDAACAVKRARTPRDGPSTTG